MRIVIDLQGAQTESRFRGIGRYSLALALAMARNAGEHEVWLALNAALPEGISAIRQAFAGILPQQRICVFDIPVPVAQKDSANAWRARAAEKIREYFIAQLRPDAVLVTSLFEGYIDDAATSVGAFCNGAKTAVILYDLIPMLNPDTYLVTPTYKEYYERNIQSLRNAGLLLSISDYSRQEAIEALALDPSQVVSISSAVDVHFQPASLSPDETTELHQRFGITRKMVLCAPGGYDARKNIPSLIAAYALLPAELRAEHQLVLASRMNDTERKKLDAASRNAGLRADELVLTGYVANHDLIALYSTAALFVFPSMHEGFGLPALEAMACGAPVIGSDRTSIPEVIGCAEALFDATSPQAMAKKIEQVLGDASLRHRLREHGLEQARRFSWDASAKRAWQAIERQVIPSPPTLSPDPSPASGRGERLHSLSPLGERELLPRKANKPRLAFVSPLPPERTGIANYSLELLPELLEHFEVELIVDQSKAVLPPSLSDLPIRSADWFAANGQAYDRIIYQFGNSPFHSHMLELLRQHPGAVVLHDFFLSGLLAYEELAGRLPGAWARALYHSHGYLALHERFLPNGIEAAKNNFPVNLEVIQNARGVIVHSAYSQTLAREWYGPHAADDWKVIPHLRTAATVIDRSGARRTLGIGEEVFLVCSFGFIDPTKLSRRLLETWLSSRLRTDPNCVLVLVGSNHGGEYGAQLAERIRKCGCRDRIRITGWANDPLYQQYLQAADLGVQLRTLSRGETSGAVLHCLNYGMPVIVNANGSMGDLPADVVWKLPDAFEDDDLAAALESLRDDPGRRAKLGAAAREHIRTRHSPRQCARMYAEALDAFYAAADTDLHALLRSLAEIPGLPEDELELQQIAQAVAQSSAEKLTPRQLLVDVSAISRNDLQTGIERVVRAQLYALLQNPPAGFRVEPVYLSFEEGVWHYRYAREYARRLLAIETAALEDEVVDVRANDVFYSPDFYPEGVIAAASSGLYRRWRSLGVDINFLIHDLLPILKPEFFPENTDKAHARWLDCIATNADRLICISGAVADEVVDTLAQQGRIQSPQIAVVHHGADIEASVPTGGLPEGAAEWLEKIAAAPSFLMLGTIEPRKGHLQSLEAFEQLWRDGTQVNLVIVGKEGWTGLPAAQRRTIPALVERLCSHPELGKRLFWLQGISDEYLREIFSACACLLFASEGEGFGLPLIEAARAELPIITRDLPVFRELAGQHACYFSGLAPDDLAAVIRAWLLLHAKGQAPSSAGIAWRTWAENATELATVLTSDNAGSRTIA